MVASTPTPQTTDESRQDAFDRQIQESKDQHSCLRRLDEFMFCMSVTNQMTYLYRYGTYNDCKEHFSRWQTCLKSKLSNTELRAEMLREEREALQAGKHVFIFRPEYAAEANERYGIPVAAAVRRQTMLES